MPERSDMKRRTGSGREEGGRGGGPKARKALTARASTADLQEQVATLARELKEAREGQTATSEVLQAISSSSGDLNPVFKAILENATRICEAKFGNLLLYDGGVFRRVAMHNAPAAWAADWQRDPRRYRASSRFIYRVAHTQQFVHVDNVALEAPDEPILKLAGARTILIVPMLQESELLGAVGIYRL